MKIHCYFILGPEQTWWWQTQKLIERLRSHGGSGRYISLHLRYEKDMLAFSGCTYGLSDAESQELSLLRSDIYSFFFIIKIYIDFV